MDNKHMIKMAESRGLFGDNSNTSGKAQTAKSPKKKPETKSATKRKKHKNVEVSAIYVLSRENALENRIDVLVFVM